MTQAQDIRNTMMLVSLNVRQWTANKLDKVATDELLKEKDAEAGAARVRKTILPKSALADINRWVGEARHTHSNNTLPWSDRGYRVLPVGNYLEYHHKMDTIKEGFDKAVEKFLTLYDDILTNPVKFALLQERLGGLYNAQEYPSAAEVAGKFHFSTHVMPIAQGQDFRCDLSNAEIQRIQADIDERVVAATQEAYKATFERLYEAVTHMATTLTKKNDNSKAPVHESLVPNMQELLDVLDRMAVGHDPELANMVNKARFLTRFPSDVLKEQSTVRNETIKAANDIKEKLTALI